MATEAVDQARKTNDRVSELSKAAARIGDVVELINTIAGADQSAGPECHHRGGPRRRSRPRFRGGGLRSQGAGRADGEGDRRDRPADRSASRPRRRIRSTTSGKSAAPSRGCPRSPRPSRQRWKSRARRPRKSPATCSRPPRAPSRFLPTSPTCSAAPARPDRPRRRCCRRPVAVRRQQPSQARSRQVPQLGHARPDQVAFPSRPESAAGAVLGAIMRLTGSLAVIQLDVRS